ncbi:MAG: CHAD domain-containing protein [Planctomycetota bacterium]|nr:MAG: CHAD domain-containing protein [Planctomycetota bacterium]
MNLESLAFSPPSSETGSIGSRLAEALPGAGNATGDRNFPWAAGKETKFAQQRVYLDSFDWRLWRAGWILETVQAGNGWQWRLFPRPGASPSSSNGGKKKENPYQEFRGRLNSSRKQYAAEHLPDGPIADRIRPLIGIRALLPRLELDIQGRELPLVDGRQKTVVRLRQQRRHLRNPLWAAAAEQAGAEVTLEDPLLLKSVRGFEKPLRQVAAYFTENGWQTQPTSTLLSDFEALELEPGQDPARYVLTIDPEAPAGQVTRDVFLTLLDNMESCLDGCLAGWDTEFLHDFRVAIRRTRSIQGQMRLLFQGPTYDRFRQSFRWLGGLTGPTRDLDVLHLKLAGYQAGLPVAVQQSLGDLDRYLERHEAQVRRKMVRSLRTQRAQRLLLDWRTWLLAGTESQQTVAAEVPVSQIAAARIWKIYRRVLKKGKALTPQSPAEGLHEVRLDCKKLRYLMEMYRGAFPGSIRRCIRVLKGLQDNLGDFNDYEVHQVLFRAEALQAVEKKAASEQILLAVGRLLEVLDQRQQGEREAFAGRFREFATDDHQRWFRDLFRRPAKQAEKALEAAHRA